MERSPEEHGVRTSGFLTFEQALAGKDIPHEVREKLTLATVPYVSFDGEVRNGQLVVAAEVAEEVREIFRTLAERQFPIHQIKPVVAYDWDDDASMAANNTSAFNYRFKTGKNELSNHALGRAIDINPMQNPYRGRDGVIIPAGAVYDVSVPGTITPEIAEIFKARGWQWGGEWETIKDWQHFEKPLD